MNGALIHKEITNEVFLKINVSTCIKSTGATTQKLVHPAYFEE